MFIDIIALIIIIYGFYSGFSRGLIKTVFDTLSILIAIIVALKLSPIVITFFDNILSIPPAVSFILGFVATFFIAMFLIRFVGKKIEGLLKVVKLNFINKIAGGALMGVVFALCFSGILWLADELRLVPETAKNTSITYPILEKMPALAGDIFKDIKPLFQEFWNKTVDTIDQIKEKAD